ncbi:hypothetical protein HaLaN_03013 [Haematococcus lacustris]|uniref:Uncharacterized protein n=1 Tax=Haematococcus lacustris TaxID=44745 RepID=A0A699YYE8_HAELA|nr:hypothetical protein HaLaN_03013 [Haematococcus lacustris]
MPDSSVIHDNDVLSFMGRTLRVPHLTKTNWSSNQHTVMQDIHARHVKVLVCEQSPSTTTQLCRGAFDSYKPHRPWHVPRQTQQPNVCML